MSLAPSAGDVRHGRLVRATRAAAPLSGEVAAFMVEQSYMTFEKMTAPREERTAWLGGLASDWEPQERAHWVVEQLLAWSGPSVVNIRATIFWENPMPSRFIAGPLSDGESPPPFGESKVAPIAGYDAAEACAAVLADPQAHILRNYELIGPEAKDMDGSAADYGAALGRHVSYVPEDWTPGTRSTSTRTWRPASPTWPCT